MTGDAHECRRCNRAFPTREAHAKHLRKVHGGRAPWAAMLATAVGLAALFAGLRWLARPRGKVSRG